MRERLVLTLRAEGDLLMRDRQRLSNVLQSDPFIRGSVLRGALADAWIALREVDDDFRRVFTSNVEFRGGYPLPRHMDQLSDEATTLTMPKSVFRNKATGEYQDRALVPDTESGFKRQSGMVTFDHKSNTAIPMVNNGLYARQRIGTLQDGSGSIDSDDGKLFTEVVVASDTLFKVEIVGERSLLDMLLTLLGAPEVDWHLTLGRSRTVLGMTKVLSHSIKPVPVSAPVDGRRHALLFGTETLLLDDHLQPRLIDAGWIEGMMSSESGAVSDLDLSNLNEATIVGWSGVHGGPKPIDTAIARGSVVSFTCDDAEALDRFAQRLTSAVGWRTAEGFGVIHLDHQIHGAKWVQGDALTPDKKTPVDNVSEKAFATARTLYEKGLRYSFWSSFRESSSSSTRQRSRSTRVEARSGRQSGIARSIEGKRETVIDAYTQAMSDLGQDDGTRERFKHAVAKELLLLERSGR